MPFSFMLIKKKRKMSAKGIYQTRMNFITLWLLLQNKSWTIRLKKGGKKYLEKTEISN